MLNRKRHRRATAQLQPRCFYCGDVLYKRRNHQSSRLSIDHVTPLSVGGKDEPENTVKACKSCNHKKDNLGIEAFRLLLERQRGVSVVFYGEMNHEQRTTTMGNGTASARTGYTTNGDSGM